MKKLSIILMMSASLSSYATIITLSNHPNSPGQHSTFTAAHNAANVDDTIYVHATGISYGDVSLTKRLVIIGEGALTSQQTQGGTIFDDFDLGSAPSPSTENANGSSLFGLNIDNLDIGIDQNADGIKNIFISRCKIKQFYGETFKIHTGFFVSESVITDFGFGSSTHFNSTFITNSIIDRINYGSSSANVTIKNCIISEYVYTEGTLFENNIFYAPGSNWPNSAGNSTFNNNLFNTNGTVNIANGSNNVIGQDPLFVNPREVNIATSTNYSTINAADYNLQSGSPAAGLSTDGTDAGVYGGGSPFIEGGTGPLRYYTMPNPVPYVMTMDIQNYSVPTNGTLNVNISAKTQN